MDCRPLTALGLILGTILMTNVCTHPTSCEVPVLQSNKYRNEFVKSHTKDGCPDSPGTKYEMRPMTGLIKLTSHQFHIFAKTKFQLPCRVLMYIGFTDRAEHVNEGERRKAHTWLWDTQVVYINPALVISSCRRI